MPKRSLALLFVGLLLSSCASAPKAKSESKAELHLEAVKHYKRGIDAYANSRFAEAIRDWQLTLDYEPAFPNVRQYIGRAQRAQKELTALSSTPDPLSFSANSVSVTPEVVH